MNHWEKTTGHNLYETIHYILGFSLKYLNQNELKLGLNTLTSFSVDIISVDKIQRITQSLICRWIECYKNN